MLFVFVVPHLVKHFFLFLFHVHGVGYKLKTQKHVSSVLKFNINRSSHLVFAHQKTTPSDDDATCQTPQPPSRPPISQMNLKGCGILWSEQFTNNIDSLNRCLHPLDLWIVGILGDGPCGSLDSSWWFQIVFFDSPKKP